jgi:tetratricopeptide (TPR) repeat protein
MTEPTHGQDGATQPTAPQPATSKDDSRKLRRILVTLISVTAVLFVAFGVIYYLGQHRDSGPSIADRDVTSAEQAVRDTPNDIAARLNLAAAYLAAGRSEEALSQYVEITKAQPKNRQAWMGSGMIHFDSEDFNAAKADFDRVVENSGGEEFSSIDPLLERAQYFLGVTNLRLGDVPGAIAALQAALAIDKTDADAWFALGGAQERAADHAAAVASYRRALEFVPSGWCDPYEGLAVAYRNLKQNDGVTYADAMAAICNGKPDDGVPQLETLTSGEFQVPALLGLGFAAEESGDAAKATQWFRKVTDLDPSNIAALTALARLGASSSPAASAPESSASTS